MKWKAMEERGNDIGERAFPRNDILKGRKCRKERVSRSTHGYVREQKDAFGGESGRAAPQESQRRAPATLLHCLICRTN